MGDALLGDTPSTNSNPGVGAGTDWRNTSSGVSNIETSGGAKWAINFPTDIVGRAGIAQYTKISTYQTFQRYSTENGGSIENKNFLGAMMLPLPRELNSSYRSDWQTLDLGFVGATRTGSFQSITAGEAIKAIASDSDFAGLLAAKNVLSMKNPYRVLEWRGPQQRTFSFTWDLNPNSHDEAKKMQEVVKTFKVNMHTRTAAYGENDSIMLQQPPLWTLEFMRKTDNKENDFLFKVGHSALTSLDIEYTPHGHAFHFDGAPLGIKIHAQFTETLILTQQDFNQNY